MRVGICRFVSLFPNVVWPNGHWDTSEEDRAKARLVCSPASRGSGPHCQSVQNSGSRASGVLVEGPRERREISLAANRSGLDHGKAGDFLEIAEVQRREFVAEMQRCRADQQVLERELDAHCFLLALDAPVSRADSLAALLV